MDSFDRAPSPGATALWRYARGFPRGPVPRARPPPAAV